MSDTEFRRPLSPTERMYFPMRGLAPPFLMQLVVPGVGDLDVRRLREAVAVASAACPGARLVRSGSTWVDSGIAPDVRVVRHTPGHALEADPILTAPIAASPEATTEVLVLDGDPVTLVLRVFHGVMDGMGMVLWLREILRALRGEAPIGHADPIADAQLVRRVGAPGLPALMIPRFRAAVPSGRQHPDLPRHLLRRRSIPVRVNAPVARVAALLAGRTRGVSRIMMPVDLRRHDPDLRSTANLALPLFLDIAPGQDWVEVKDQIKAGLRERRELNQMAAARLTDVPEPATGLLLRALNGLGVRFGRNLASATVSHMGRFDLAELAVPGFRPTAVYVLPQHSVAMPLLFGIMESGGNTDLTVSARGGAGVEERLEALLDDIATMFERVAGRGADLAS
ncbi:peptide synthetase [Nocardia takedensis]|uniref:hypothetical protein n=1 Tax=Nocardia takedensis TaxID=259390 RepID=UPI000308440B|nr:hypothetical protein [Nocardia takedensis]